MSFKVGTGFYAVSEKPVVIKTFYNSQVKHELELLKSISDEQIKNKKFVLYTDLYSHFIEKIEENVKNFDLHNKEDKLFVTVLSDPIKIQIISLSFGINENGTTQWISSHDFENIGSEKVSFYDLYSEIIDDDVVIDVELYIVKLFWFKAIIANKKFGSSVGYFVYLENATKYFSKNFHVSELKNMFLTSIEKKNNVLFFKIHNLKYSSVLPELSYDKMYNLFASEFNEANINELIENDLFPPSVDIINV